MARRSFRILRGGPAILSQQLLLRPQLISYEAVIVFCSWGVVVSPHFCLPFWGSHSLASLWYWNGGICFESCPKWRQISVQAVLHVVACHFVLQLLSEIVQNILSHCHSCLDVLFGARHWNSVQKTWKSVKMKLSKVATWKSVKMDSIPKAASPSNPDARLPSFRVILYWISSSLTFRFSLLKLRFLLVWRRLWSCGRSWQILSDNEGSFAKRPTHFSLNDNVFFDRCLFVVVGAELSLNPWIRPRSLHPDRAVLAGSTLQCTS